MQINERFIKLTSRIPYHKDIELGQDIPVTIGETTFLANCVKLDQLDQQDGTINVVYSLKTTLE